MVTSESAINLDNGTLDGVSLGAGKTDAGSRDVLRGQERQREILGLARSEGRVDVTRLALKLAVSAETIRRDLRVLEDHGLVRREYGAAYPVESAAFETDLNLRKTQLLPEKKRIAAEAVRHLDDAETVFVDEGFLPGLLAKELPEGRALTVVTASLPVASQLAGRPNYTVLMLGGRVRGRTMATVDYWATRMLSEFAIDLAFIGANGISVTEGLTTPDPVVAEVKRAALRVSRRAVFVGAHNKFGSTSFCRFAEIADLDLIVTDNKLPATVAHQYVTGGAAVLRV